MQLYKGIYLLIFGVLGATIPAISQAQWQAMPADYAKGTETVTKTMWSTYSILTGTEWGGVNCFADPPTGGACDVEVTVGFNWTWTGDISTITNLLVTPNGDLVGDSIVPNLAFFSSSVATFKLQSDMNSNALPGPYNLAPVGIQNSFTPSPTSPKIKVTGQVRSIAQMPGGPFTSGTSARSNIYWTMP